MKYRLAYSLTVAFAFLVGLPLLFPSIIRAWQVPSGSSSDTPGTTGKRKVVKSDADWRKSLTRPQYDVIRQKATEPPFSGKYATSHASGIFKCAACGAELFSSKAKFDSGTGWPSFWRPIDPKSIETTADYHLAEARVEVICRDCGGHLGHVFEDGPPPTGLRYCINSLSLKLAPPTAVKSEAPENAKSEASSSAKTKSKTKVKSRARGTTLDTAPPEPDLSTTPIELPKEKNVNPLPPADDI